MNDELPAHIVVEGLTFVSNATELMRFNADGTVWANPDLKPDETARRVIELLRTYWRSQTCSAG